MADSPTLFEAVLAPHRSLSARQFWLMMAGMTAIGFCAGIAFMVIGAWPVFGFLGLDVALVYFAFRANYRGARRREILRLTRKELSVLRIEVSGTRSRWVFQPYWLRVYLGGEGGRADVLTLTSHGRSLAIGEFLSTEERKTLAQSLIVALRQVRETPMAT
ncbi:MAG: DUF2244 domain-containing protein [Alphaproteobacteria bacterium]